MNLFFFLRGEVILDVKIRADFIRRLAFDEASDLSAAEVQELGNIEVICSHDELKEHCLIHINETLLPFAEVPFQMKPLCFIYRIFNIRIVLHKPSAEVDHQ